MKLVIGYFYPNLLNLYGDNGNVEIMAFRAYQRGFDVEIVKIDIDFKLSSPLMKKINFVFMGGGPDASQKNMYDDLFSNKAPFLKEYIDNNGVALFICGAYQLLGNYYKAADGSVLKGLEIFNMYTQHFGNHKPRCIGNMVCEINSILRSDVSFNSNNTLGQSLVGFENHGGRTYLDKSVLPLAKVQIGFGNNGTDGTEGALYKNAIGTYSHGPFLSKNSHIADYLLAKSLKLDTLKRLDDSLIKLAHTASKNLKQ